MSFDIISPILDLISWIFDLVAHIVNMVFPIFALISCIFSFFALVFNMVSDFRDCKSSKKFRKQNLVFVAYPSRLAMTLFQINFTSLHYEMVHKHGPVFGTRFLGRHMIVVSVPEIAQTVLSKEGSSSFTSFKDPILNFFLRSTAADDEQWKRSQSIITSSSNEKFEPWLDDNVDTLMKNFDESFKKSPKINVIELFGAFTLDSIMQVAFGTKVDYSLVNRNHDKKKIFLKVSHEKLTELDNVENVENRKEKANNNILELLLEAKAKADEEIKKFQTGGKSDGTIRNDDKTVKLISKDEMIEQFIQYFMAAYEATTSIISLVSYFLALNLELQDRLYQEIEVTLEKLKPNSPDQEFNDPTKLITPKSLSQFEYLEAIISETLRMYPPVDTERTASKDMKLETKDGKIVFDVKKGDIIHFPAFAMHHDQVQFPEPYQFDPERFLHEPTTFHKYAYLPFGSGPEKCVAQNFALLRTKLALINVVHRYKLNICRHTKAPPDAHKSAFEV